jgi:hypothetical protein
MGRSISAIRFTGISDSFSFLFRQTQSAKGTYPRVLKPSGLRFLIFHQAWQILRAGIEKCCRIKHLRPAMQGLWSILELSCVSYYKSRDENPTFPFMLLLGSSLLGAAGMIRRRLRL